MSDPNVKQFTVTGVAAENFLNKGGSRRRRRSSANKTAKQEGGSSGTVVQVQANRAPDAPPSNSVSQAKPSNSTDLTKTVTNSAPATTTPPTPVANQTGGKDKKAVKVILAAGKKKDSKVILSPTKVRKIPGAPSERAKTRKVAKKIRVSLHGLNKRVTRANTIRKEATKQPIEAVKKTLVTAKLIKPDSKAPEDILRKMYADYMMLKNRAL
jgi:hypothetical protein